jgi:hypothetical protein
MGERTCAYRILVGRSEVRRPLGRPRWEAKIKMDLMKWDGGMDWIHLALVRDRWCALVNVVKNHWVPQNVRYFFTS